MSRTFEVRHVDVSIDRPAPLVYDFMSKGENLVRWATGLGTEYEHRGDEWLIQGPDGLVRARLPKWNEFGVVDHTVTLPTAGPSTFRFVSSQMARARPSLSRCCDWTVCLTRSSMPTPRGSNETSPR